MRLNPADIHDVAFSKPPIGRRGFDAEEVDAFLAEAEQELVRLIEENNELRTKLAYAGGGGPDADSRLAAEVDDMNARLDRARRDRASAEQAMRAMRSDLERARSQGGPVGGDGEPQALRVLMMAQRTADDHVADARREADGLLSEARSKAEEVTRQARAKADALERDARQRHQEAMDGLDAKRTAVQRHIEELMYFARDYRTRLTAYLESQLRDHDARQEELMAELAGADSDRSGDVAKGLIVTR
jgi:DivIVA domain-containing protein